MYFVTGGAGFIGSNIISALEKKVTKHNVVCDWLGTEDKWRNIAKRDLSDIITPKDTFEFLQDNANQIQAVLHMGALTSTTETNADAIISNNFRLSCDLWNFCTKNQ